MNAFIVEVENRAGQLSRVVTALGKAGVNISTGAGIGLSDTGGFGFLTADEAGAREALKGAGIFYREVPVVGAMIVDEAGGLAQAASRIAGAGVNVHLVVPMGMGDNGVTVAFGVDDPDAARKALGDLAAEA